jgi:hypothetical protein
MGAAWESQCAHAQRYLGASSDATATPDRNH